MKIRKALKEADVLLVCDSREQSPLNLAPFRCEVAGLATGDYSVKNLEHKICVERKSLADLTQSLGRERERFDKEMQRILAYPHRCLVIEGALEDVVAHKYQSRIHPNAVLSSLMGYASHGIPFVFCGSRDQMSDLVKRFLFLSAQRIWQSNYDFALNIISSVANSGEQPLED